MPPHARLAQGQKQRLCVGWAERQWLSTCAEVLLDAKSFLANRILHADEEGGDVDREVFIHQGNIGELRFDM